MPYPSNIALYYVGRLHSQNRTRKRQNLQKDVCQVKTDINTTVSTTDLSLQFFGLLDITDFMELIWSVKALIPIRLADAFLADVSLPVAHIFLQVLSCSDLWLWFNRFHCILLKNVYLHIRYYVNNDKYKMMKKQKTDLIKYKFFRTKKRRCSLLYARWTITDY